MMNSLSASVQLLWSISRLVSSSSVTSARLIILVTFESGISAGEMLITSRTSSIETLVKGSRSEMNYEKWALLKANRTKSDRIENIDEIYAETPSCFLARIFW